jgi:hypothetical protein
LAFTLPGLTLRVINSDKNISDQISDRNAFTDIISSSLNKIKRNLDPNYSYIVLEMFNQLACSRNHFQTVADAFFANKTGVIGYKFFYDDTTQECMMIVKLDSTCNDEWVRKIANLNLSKDIYIKFYYSLEQPIRRGYNKSDL